MIRVRIGPREAVVVRAHRLGGWCPSSRAGSRDASCANSACAPVRSDRRWKAAGHRFHQRHVPALAAPRRDVTVGGPVEGAELVIRELAVVNEGDAPAEGIEAEGADLLSRSTFHRVDDLADEDGRGSARRNVWLKTFRIMSARFRSPHSKLARKTKSPAGFGNALMAGWKWSTSTPSGITWTGFRDRDARNPSRLNLRRHPHLVHLVRPV